MLPVPQSVTGMASSFFFASLPLPSSYAAASHAEWGEIIMSQLSSKKLGCELFCVDSSVSERKWGKNTQLSDRHQGGVRNRVLR